MKHLFLFFFLLLTTTTFAQNQNSIDSLLNERLDVKKLLADLHFINGHVNPKKGGNNGFRFITEDEWKIKFKEEVQFIKKAGSLTRGEFYLRLYPLFNALKDEHLNFAYRDFAKDSIKKDSTHHPFVLPLRLLCWGDSVVVVCSESLPAKTLVVSINSIPIRVIADSLMRYTGYAYQRYYQKHRYASLDFASNPVLVYQLFHFRDSVEIKYIHEGESEVRTTYLKLLDMYGSLSQNKCYTGLKNSELKFKDDAALLRINTFSLANLDSVITKYNDQFAAIKERHVQKLIIDVRYNGGGSDLVWMLLLPYLTDKRIQFNCGSGKYETTSLLSTSKIDVSKIKKELRFAGKIYLLIGPRTFSSAIRFTNVMSYNHVTDSVFGLETMGQACHYGDLTYKQLPETKLRVSVSSKLFFALNCSCEPTGMLPDVVFTYASASDYIDSLLRGDDPERILELISGQ